MTLLDPRFMPVPPIHVWINPERRRRTPHTHDAEFLVEIETLLLRINRTRVGRTLLKALEQPFTIITPLLNAVPDHALWKFPNVPDAAAFTSPWDPYDGVAKDEPMRHHGGPNAGQVASDPRLGTGRGTECWRPPTSAGI